jgi:hypothetical protein
MSQQNMNTSFGQYIDTLIRLYATVEEKGLTDYIKKNLSNDSNEAPNRISSRQISRMRQISATEFPEGKGLLKLIETLPGELQTLSPMNICNRLLAGIEPYLNYQEELINSYSSMIPISITVASGRHAPLALESDEIISAMTQAVDKGVKYTFVYPNQLTYVDTDTVDKLTNSWKLEIKDRIIDHWRIIRKKEAIKESIKSRSAIDKTVSSEKDLNIFKEKVEASIHVNHSVLNTDFWFLLPSNYSVFYNVESSYEKIDIPRYGVFSVSGSPIIRASRNELEKKGLIPVSTLGWLRMNEEDFLGLAESYNLAFSKDKQQK